jgi:hypothetical protein
MAPTAHRVVDRVSLDAIVPRRLARVLSGSSFTFPMKVLVFPERVITSGALARGLRSVDAVGERLLVLGNDLTVEACKVATEAQAEFVMSKNFFGWSDADYQGIRAEIAAHAKAPDVRSREDTRRRGRN